MSSFLARLSFRIVFMVIFYAPLVLVTALPLSWTESSYLHAAVVLYVISGLFIVRWLTLRACGSVFPARPQLRQRPLVRDLRCTCSAFLPSRHRGSLRPAP